MTLERYTNLASIAAAASPLRSGAIGHCDILACYVALLCLDKSDLWTTTGFREHAFFQAALGLKTSH